MLPHPLKQLPLTSHLRRINAQYKVLLIVGRVSNGGAHKQAWRALFSRLEAGTKLHWFGDSTKVVKGLLTALGCEAVFVEELGHNLKERGYVVAMKKQQ